MSKIQSNKEGDRRRVADVLSFLLVVLVVVLVKGCGG